MKKLAYLPMILVILTGHSLFAQAPKQISYQAVVRNAAGTPVSAGTSVTMQFVIHTGTATGTTVYTETSVPLVSNDFGLVTTAIGTNAALDSVHWGSGSKWLQVLADVGSTGTFTDMGTTQMNAVPYALYAASSPAVSNPTVGFSLYSPADTIVPAGGSATRRYGVVSYNDGGGNYNASTGEYTAPSAGIYHFDAVNEMAGATGYTTGYVQTAFLRNGFGVPGGFSEIRPSAVSSLYLTVSNSINIKLAAGDKIKVVFANQTNVPVEATMTNNFNSFSGYKVY